MTRSQWWKAMGQHLSGAPLGSRTPPPTTAGATARDLPPDSFLAMVEVVGPVNGLPPHHLLECTYSASQTGEIALALNGVAPSTVDRALDSIVPNFPPFIPGVRYLDAGNEPLLIAAMRRSEIIFGRTERFLAIASQVVAQRQGSSVQPFAIDDVLQLLAAVRLAPPKRSLSPRQAGPCGLLTRAQERLVDGRVGAPAE